MMVRLQKYLAQCGVASRRHAEEIIAAGRVCVNGAVATVGVSVMPGSDVVIMDGGPVRPSGDAVYLLLNKPRNVITSADDPQARRTVLDCLHGVQARVFPVGRLDMDVEGALILTNDGELAHRLMHPSYGVDKVYLAWVYGHVFPDTAIRLEQGVMLDDGVSAPARAVIMSADRNGSLIQLTLHEGRKREVKRMCAAVGHNVRELQRIAFGPVQVKGLRPGEWRHLREQEICGLRELVGLHHPHRRT